MPSTRAGSKRKRSEPLAESNDNDSNIKSEDSTPMKKTSETFKDGLKRFHFSPATENAATAHDLSPSKPPADRSTIKTRSTPLRKRQTNHSTPIDSPLHPTTSPSKPRKPATPSPRKSPSKRSSGYAPPSTYAHLPLLTDVITPDLICLFVGTNPGIRTATSGHAYAHPSNLFWRLLHSSGCTDRRLPPTEDVNLPRLYAMGNTNIVSRPTRNGGELSKAEMAAGTPILEEKVRHFRPEAVCVVGKGIWEAIWRWRHGRALGKGEFEYGWQEGRMGAVEGEWEGAWVYVTSSTSGLAASLGPKEKEEIWRPFGEWVRERREERVRNGVKNPVWEGETRFVKKEKDKEEDGGSYETG
ncbi:G/U mismatch-specific uracil DNA glycosylase-like protein [Elsinoe australis]|uniref:G/U mismatch-specific uracil DNA glycosylase-like protein n=1 Tax=Elsinoe australis TaxID=40998 RepID=A0A4U7ANZ0_9PEZI|nr:G/U mismatch-specific uracil DNA glycosylase-like protein [Elsinoe australis]